MANEREYWGVYLPDSDGYPVAVFSSVDEAHKYRRTTFGRDVGRTMQATSLGRNAEAKAMLANPAAPAPEAAESDPDEHLRSELRAEMLEERRRERLRAEVEQELDDAEDPPQQA